MSMLEKFFSVQYAGRGDLFRRLAIWEDEAYRSLQGTCPVISLSFAAVKEKSCAMTVSRISQILTNLYSANRSLMEDGDLDDKEKRFFTSVDVNMDETTATMAIHQLSIYLSRYYGKKVIILLDEYDTPMQEAYVNGYWDELVSFTRSMFNAAFKTNVCLERASIVELDEQIVYDQLGDDEQAVWGLLLASCYLKVNQLKAYATDFGEWKQEYELELTNFEVGAMFRRMIKKWFGRAEGGNNDINWERVGNRSR